MKGGIGEMDREEFLRRAFSAATEARKRSGLRFSPVIAAAQAALESNWGRSQLARMANNLLGVKSGSSWRGETINLPTKEFINGKWIDTVATWRKYPDWQHTFEDYGRLIERVYPQSAAVADDPRAFLEGLVSGRLKYATDPDYVNKVWRIVEQYKDILLESPAESLPEPEWLLLVYGPDGGISHRLPLSKGFVLRVDPERKRVHIREG